MSYLIQVIFARIEEIKLDFSNIREFVFSEIISLDGFQPVLEQKGVDHGPEIDPEPLLDLDFFLDLDFDDLELRFFIVDSFAKLELALEGHWGVESGWGE